jgi:chemotaxis protein MotA
MRPILDKTTILGLILGGAAILGGQYLESGTVRLIFQSTALLIVFGGTLGAVCLSFPAPHLRAALREVRGVFWEPQEKALPIISQIIEFAYRSRREGILSLEKEIKAIPEPFFRRTLQLAVDGLEPPMIREIMEMELDQLNDAGLTPARVFEAAGGYAPTIGILGAVLGLIQVMNFLTDPVKLGPGVAVAFVATIYGVGSANLFFLPLGHRLRLRHQRRMLLKSMTLEGVLAVCAGNHPRLIEEYLKGFLADVYLKPTAAGKAAPARRPKHLSRSPATTRKAEQNAAPSLPTF